MLGEMLSGFGAGVVQIEVLRNAEAQRTQRSRKMMGLAE
jgi:hypothetical protein